MTNDCDILEDYLLGDLAADEAARFTTHLDVCAACREAVDEQRWLDALLKDDSGALLERAPQSLHEAIRVTVRRRQLKWIGLCTAVAAAVAIAAGWTLLFSRSADRSQSTTLTVAEQKNSAIRGAGTTAVMANVKRPQASFVADGSAIAIPVESADDDVTIVQLYPTTQSERRMRRELVSQSIQLQSNGG